MNELAELLKSLADYKDYIGYAVIGLTAFIILLLVFNAIRHALNLMREKSESLDEDALRNRDYNTLEKDLRGGVLRSIIAPDAIDPGPNSYMPIQDGGKEVYARSFTISDMPKRTIFANTFAQLLDFKNCTSSIFVIPLSEASVIHKLDRQITVLASEYAASSGDINRQRKLNGQFQESYAWADAVESGENKFFDVGFLFTIFADDLQTLNKQSDAFYTSALQKNIHLTNVYGVQPEAFVKNMPLNNELNIGSPLVNSDCVPYYMMDKFSVSTLYNYTQSSFSHRDGIPLGRDMSTGDPVLYDLYDHSHDGFTIVIAGKTGCGKSAMIKIFASRAMLHNYHFVSIDSQTKKGTSAGEYAGIAELCNGINFKISTHSDEIMNIFDVSESTRQEKISATQFREIRTLELADKISMVVYTLSTMIQGNKEYDSMETQTYINRILIDVCTDLYRHFGIIDGDPDSLYEEGQTVVRGQMTTGRVQKELPTITDFYKMVLLAQSQNDDPTLSGAYNIILMAMKDYVRELYYTEDSCIFIPKESFLEMPYMPGTGYREWQNPKTKKKERVLEIHGIKPYYDGQSTMHISRDCPFTNIDISQLPDNERGLARQIAMDFVNENFIKKNSESIDSADKLALIVDEAHESFAFPYMRKTLDMLVRTARKRHAGIILSSQTVKEYGLHPETEAILKQAATKFVFKQDFQDKKYLMETLGITESQADTIVSRIGGNVSDDSDKKRHRGEVCIIDNKNVCFTKIDMLSKTEALPVETDATEVEKQITILSASA